MSRNDDGGGAGARARAGDTGDAVVDALSEAARAIAAADAGPGPTPAAWHRLQAVRARPQRSSAHRRLLVLGAGAAAIVALFIVARGIQRAHPLTYVVGGGTFEQDGYIRGVDKADNQVRFSDGSHVDLAPGARVSVLSRGAHGARLRVEDGEASFAVMHRPHASWSVEAGPYIVYVTGTAFAVRWSGADEVVEVRLRSGSVQVGGPMLPDRVALRAGQTLTARLATREVHILEAGSASTVAVPQAPQGTTAGAAQPAVTAAVAAPPAQAAAPAVGVEAQAPAERPAATTDADDARAGGSRAAAAVRRVRVRAPAVAPPASWAPGRWPAHVAGGNATAVLAEADAHGLDRTLVDVDGTALVALADAARYSGRPEMAVRALLAQRQRFPDTAAAQTAAFLLGRLADDQGESASGLAWYRRYLSETPDGPYAAEALGRKMLAVERLSGRAAARPIANQYLRRFPNGTYLLQAHSILANQ